MFPAADGSEYPDANGEGGKGMLAGLMEPPGEKKALPAPLDGNARDIVPACPLPL